MIAEEDDHGVVVVAGGRERVEDAADLVVQARHHAVVHRGDLPPLLVGQPLGSVGVAQVLHEPWFVPRLQGGPTLG